MIENYVLYLNYLDKKITNYFENQKDYIFCKPGCSYCCKKGVYPYTNLEFLYLIIGLKQLNLNIQNNVIKNAKKIIEFKRQSNKAEDFMYKCPFLFNNKCLVYNYRGIICRSHGLPYFIDENSSIKVPQCVFIGLNYSNVYDKSTNVLSDKLFELSRFKHEPLAYNLSRKFLLNNDLTKYLNIKFDKDEPLIDRFCKYFNL